MYADPHDRLGMVYVRQGDFSRALVEYYTAIERDPRHTATYYHLGNLYRLQGDFKKTIQAYRKVLEIDPHHLLACGSLAIAHLADDRVGSRHCWIWQRQILICAAPDARGAAQ